MLNRSASLAMSTSVLKALPGKLDIKRHSPSILYIQYMQFKRCLRFSFVDKRGEGLLRTPKRVQKKIHVILTFIKTRLSVNINSV